MSPPSPSERSHPPNPPPYGSGRGSSSRSAPPYSAPQPVRPTAYSSLGDALGSGGRQPQYMPTDSSYPPPPSSAGGASLPSYPHVSPEGRYYYTPSGMPTSSYDYQYQSSSYETPSQYTHSTLPPMRSASPASHPPPPQSSSHHPAPHTPYASPFPHAQYAPPPSITHHWADEQWAPSQSFSPDPVNPMFAGRSDLAQSPQPEARGYTSQPYSSTPVNTRIDERAYNVSPKSKGKARERDVASSIDRLPVGETNPVPLDYSKLFNTYKNIFADCENLYTGRIDLSKRSSSLDEVDRLIRSADLGLRLFNSASPVTGAGRRLSGDSLLSAEPENPSPVPAPKRQVEAALNTEGQTCLGCGATSTPEWRRGPLGPRTLCNACGLVYAKLIKKRSREVTSNALTTPSQSHAVPQSSIIEDAPAAMHSPGNGDSEDEDSYENDPA